MSIIKKVFAVLLTAIVLVSFTACNNSAGGASDAVNTGGSDGSAAEAPHELQDSISQEDWDMHRQYIDVATGITMSYVEMGSADGPAIILEHGMTDNSRSWSLAAPYFCEAGYHVYMPDMRGQGYSDAPDTRAYTVIDYAQDLAAFMDAKGIEHADIVGHSLGSMAVQAFSILYPERCDHVVLDASAPACIDSMGTFVYDYVRELPEDEHIDDDFIQGWYYIENEVDQEFLEHMMEESQQLSSDAWRAIAAGACMVDLRPYYQYYDADIPLLILHGSGDTFFTDEMQEGLLAAFPSATYITYEGIGHNIQYEIPEQIASDILAFIEE